MPEVAVIGAGISGLVAGRRLAAAGAQVTVLEAAERVGGQLLTTGTAGRSVELGAEAIHTGAPGPLALIEELGLSDRSVAAGTGTTWIWTERGLQPLPNGFGPAGPTRLMPMLRAGVLSPSGALRAGLEPFVRRTAADDDVAVGDYLDRRFGRQVTDRLVDPLLGGLHSGDVRKLSVRSATPQLAMLADRHRSLLLRRRPAAPTGPTFFTLRGGMASLAERLASSLDELRLGTTVTSLRRADRRIQVRTADGDVLEVDSVVLATPAAAAAGIVGSASPTARAGLQRLRAASVAIAILTYPPGAGDLPAFGGTGIMVPSTAGRLLKAATFLTTKWPHLDHDGRLLIRASAGRIGDERAGRLDDATLVDRLRAEVSVATGLGDDPEASLVHRWPATMPQLEVGHRTHLRGVTTALARDLPGVVLAGAPYDGPGLAACVRSGANAAERATGHLEEQQA